MTKQVKKIASSSGELSKVKISVAFILLHEFTLFAFSGFIDALRIAGDEADNSRQRDCKWTVISPTLQPIRSNSGVEVIPWETFTENPADFDYLAVVGGRVEPQRNTDPRITDYIRRVADNGGFIIGICTATFVLARAGIMKGRKCCIHWVHREEFEYEFPEIPVDSDTIFIEDRNLITCSGGRSAVDVALYLIEKHCGAASARKGATGLVIESLREGYMPQPNMEASWFSDITHPLIKRAITIMNQFISRPVLMAEIARHLQVSENTLYRVFDKVIGISPAKLLRIMRLAHGHWSLHNTKVSISQIAYSYQFSDASHFTQTHRKFYGMTPTQARAKGPESSKSFTGTIPLDNIRKRILEGGLFIFSSSENLI